MSAEPALSDVLASLSRLLAAEKASLLGRELAQLGAMAAEKTRLGDALDRLLVDRRNAAQLSVYRKTLKAVIDAAAENESLLAAARDGVAAAQSRVKDILKRQRVVGVYDERGDKPLAPDAGVTRRKLA